MLPYLDAAMERDGAKHIARALGDGARARGMSEIARESAA
ncbi:hypothetical protein [Novosphingobium sp. BL-52-GroH]